MCVTNINLTTMIEKKKKKINKTIYSASSISRTLLIRLKFYFYILGGEHWYMILKYKTLSTLILQNYGYIKNLI